MWIALSPVALTRYVGLCYKNAWIQRFLMHQPYTQETGIEAGLIAFCIRVERTRLLRLLGADVASHAGRI